MHLKLNDLPLTGNNSLVDLFKRIPDPRSRFGKTHTLHGMLSLTYCAFLCGVRNYAGIDDWSKNLTKKEIKQFDFGTREIPTASIIQKTLRFLDVEFIEKEFTRWFIGQNSLQDKWIAFDGKTLRGSRHGKQRGLHLLGVLLHEDNTIVMQTLVGEKTNEIPIAQKILKNMKNVEGAVFTLDAIHTQSETARIVVKEKGAEYVLMVKDNQKELKKSLKCRIFPMLSSSAPKRRDTGELKYEI